MTARDREIVKYIREVRDAQKNAPVVRWGIVAQASPLLVNLDGSVDENGNPVSAPAQSGVGSLAVGDRVVCVEQHRRIIVTSRRIVDVDWTDITTGFASGFTSGGTPGPLQYSIKNGVVYWRGGVTGSLPANAYTTVVTGLPAETRHSASSPIRGGASFSNGNGGMFEMNSNGELRFAHQSGGDRSWGAFVTSYPQGD